LPDKFRIRIFGLEKDLRWANPFFLEQAFPPESRMDFLRARVLGLELFFCALICSWAWRLATGSEKFSFVSAKSMATELVSVSSFGVCDSV
jgi:hypothetical protein